MSVAKRTKRIILIAIIAVLVVAIVICSVFLGIYFHKEPIDEYRVVGYVMADSVEHFDELHLESYTHLIYGFIDINIAEDAPVMSEEVESGLVATRKYIDEHCPHVKLLAVMGGNGFCKFTRTAENRAIIVDYVAEIKDKYGIEGIDLDWEYPRRNTNNQQHCIHDPGDYLNLYRDFRARFGKDFLLSIALCGSVTFMNDLPMRKFSEVLDFVNVMTYDLGLNNHCTYSETTFSMFNANLGGFKKSQLNFGLPFYSRSAVKEHDYYHYDQLMEMLENGEIELKGNKNRSYAYLDGARLSFDTREQLMRKVEHVKTRGYGGVFCWHVGCNLDGSLMAEANEILNG